MKKNFGVLCIALITAVLLLLSACGAQDTPGSNDSQPPAANSDDGNMAEGDASGGNQYTFEAEHVDLTYISGHGWSNEVMGTGLLIQDKYGADASGGYALGYLYENGNEIEFYLNASKAIDDATLVLRCTMEHKDASASLAWDEFEVTVNDGDPIQYRTMSFNNIPGLLTVKNALLPFSNKTIGTISLQEGENVIRFKVTNDITMEGTMQATAPIMDCIILKTDSDATIEWASGYPMNTDYIEANQ